jgi:NMD protein affecting ribosome stability and mRNA decay
MTSKKKTTKTTENDKLTMLKMKVESACAYVRKRGRWVSRVAKNRFLLHAVTDVERVDEEGGSNTKRKKDDAGMDPLRISVLTYNRGSN